MQAAAYILIVLGVCYFVLLGLEYNKFMQGQNWIVTQGKVKDALNSLPMTKYEPNELNQLSVWVNWSYITYSYEIGKSHYDQEQELGPHLTVFDSMIKPLEDRYPAGSPIEVRYNPRNPKESRIGFEVFRPVEMFAGSGLVCVLVGGLVLFLTNVVSTTSGGDDAEANQSLEYFAAKKRKGR